MKTKNNNLTTLNEFKNKHYGKPGSIKRDELDAGYKNFKLGVLLPKPDLKKG